jgi:hypothetical protein
MQELIDLEWPNRHSLTDCNAPKAVYRRAESG